MYFASIELVIAYILAIFFHEAGHLLSLWILKKKVYSIHFKLTGLVIEHEGDLTPLQMLISSASGPALGLVYAYMASFISSLFFEQLFSLSAGLSLALSIFNSIPAIPLDGATVLGALCLILKVKEPSKVLMVSCIVTCTGMFLIGIYLFRYNMGYGLVLAATILMLYTMFDEGIVKTDNLR